MIGIKEDVLRYLLLEGRLELPYGLRGVEGEKLEVVEICTFFDRFHFLFAIHLYPT